MATKKLSIITRLSCLLIGWNPVILQECGEASFRTLRKYVSAITILSIIWGTIGFCFAERYIGLENNFAKAGVAFVFVTIIVCIERFIILTVGKLGIMGLVRFLLAMLMKVLGATIFDQIIFRNDIDVKMKEIRTNQINTEIPNRTGLIDDEIAKLTKERNNKQHIADSLYQLFTQKPVIQTTEVTTTYINKGVDADGNPIKEKHTTTSRIDIPNPIRKQADDYTNQVKDVNDRLTDLQKQKLTVAEDVRNEYENAKVGFLEELHAIVSIITGDKIAFAFYMVMFIFLAMLETLVVTSKAKDSHSDYDLIIEHQLNIKSTTLKNTEDCLLKK